MIGLLRPGPLLAKARGERGRFVLANGRGAMLDPTDPLAGAPFLGICVGMQLMADMGREHGDTPGFGWIPGEVVHIRPADPALKIPLR